MLLNRINTLLALVRRNERDVVNLYQLMTKYSRLLTGTSMINFGFWTHETNTIQQAQQALCAFTGNFAELDSAKRIIDVGSGFSGPAEYWNSEYKLLDNLICVDINLHALKTSCLTNTRYSHDQKHVMESSLDNNVTITKHNSNHCDSVISFVNATATSLPFANSFADRIIALESAQHFKSFMHFINESHRVLEKGGIIVIAIPVVINTRANGMPIKHTLFDSLRNVRVLGILSFTWASEHYELNRIKSIISNHFKIKETLCIGKSVYGPLTDFYVQDREKFRRMILEKQSSFIKKLALDIMERTVYRSALKMKEVSQSGDIDYVLIKAINE